MKSDQTWFNKIICNEWRVKSFVDMLRYLNSAYNILKKYCTASAINTLDKCELIRYNLSNEKYNLVKFKYVLG